MKATKSLLSSLAEITGTGNFHATGSAPFFFPELQVVGFGEVAFPMSTSQAKELIAVAEAAPFGKGTRTVFDESVRKCWQIDASCFSLKSEQWAKFLKQTVESIQDVLGIQGKISAIRKGRPYTLACTKTDSSHRHALAVRASDISLLAKLQALPAP